MNTTDDKTALLPEGIVYKLFDQSKQGHEANAQAIKELVGAVSDLANTITTPPINKDVIDIINKHDGDVKDIHKTTIEAIQNHDQRDETRVGGLYDNLKDVSTDSDCAEVKALIGKNETIITKLSNRISTMILIVLITFSLMSISYLYVRHGINQTVQDCVTQQLEGKVIK